MARRRPRGLKPEEEDLWQRVAKTATPLHPSAPAPARVETPPRRPEPGARPTKAPDPIPPFRLGQSSPSPGRGHDLAPTLAERLSDRPVRMDRKAFTRLNRGKMTPEARIDLHGMTLAQAHPALIGFILSAQASGKRLVLVITGKGRDRDDDGPIPERRGALRHQTPHWLTAPPLGQAVLQVTQAHRKHGGEGAFYVYLRRR